MQLYTFRTELCYWHANISHGTQLVCSGKFLLLCCSILYVYSLCVCSVSMAFKKLRKKNELQYS